MSKPGILLGKLWDMNLSGDEMVTLLEPLSEKNEGRKRAAVGADHPEAGSRTRQCSVHPDADGRLNSLRNFTCDIHSPKLHR